MSAGNGPMRDADEGLLSAVGDMFEGLVLDNADVALKRIALGYAEQIDHAEQAGRHAAWVLRQARADHADAEVIELIQALQSKLAERTAWADLGPKLLAVLVELGATPKARAALRKGAPTATGQGKLGRMRAAASGA